MKKNNFITSFQFSILLILSSFSISCEGNDDEKSLNSQNIGKSNAIFNPNVTYGSMTDQDGNVYKTVLIGNQVWMAENLRTTKYNDGTSIIYAEQNNNWSNLKVGGYSSYDNTKNSDYIATYGFLYNWYAISSGKLAPKGWHVATDSDWNKLISFLGGEVIAGAKLKEQGTLHWKSPNDGATNESGFTALPGGSRSGAGPFNFSLSSGYWWPTINNFSERYAWHPSIHYNADYVRKDFLKIENLGLSVRCVKD